MFHSVVHLIKKKEKKKEKKPPNNSKINKTNLVSIGPSLAVHRLVWEMNVDFPLILSFKFKGDIFTLQNAWVMYDGRTNSISNF